ncbi:MAG: hypothetical protein AB8G77_19635 [Rhodothermales bacterium]
MIPLKYLIENNILCLEQGIRLLTEMDDRVYTHTDSPVYNSGIGDHYRHCLEHYLCFLDGIDARSIDYDARKRDKRISSDRLYAIQITEQIVRQLNLTGCEGVSLKVKMDCRLDDEEGAIWTDSTPERDLQYLQAHTIHHYALIAMILRLQGHEPGEGFGVAPSTLTYLKSQTQAV